MICPACIAALLRDEVPTQQEYAKWAKKVAKPKRKATLSAPIERGMELND